MLTARVKTIPFRKLLVKWIHNGTTYLNIIVAQMLNTVMSHLFSMETDLIHNNKFINNSIQNVVGKRFLAVGSICPWSGML